MTGGNQLSMYVRAAIASWWLLLLCAGTAGTVALTLGGESVYEATATLVVGEALQDPNPDQAAIQASHLQALTFAELALRQAVLNPVAAELDVRGGWRDLQDQVEATAVIDTPFLEIAARASLPQQARAIANQVAHQLVEVQASVTPEGEDAEREQFLQGQLRTLEGKISATQNRVAELQSALSEPLTADQEETLRAELLSLEELLATWQGAYTDLAAFLQEQEEPRLLSILELGQADLTLDTRARVMRTAIAAIVGLLVGLGIVTVWERSKDTVKSEDDLAEELGITLLGAIRPLRGSGARQRLIAGEESADPAADDYRILRNNIEFASDSQPIRCILVTSPPGGAGKTTTVANLGSVMAAAGLKTVLVDGDLRAPSLHELLGLPRAPGLGDYLRSEDLSIQDIELATPTENIRMITSGAPLPNPADWLSSPRIAELFASLRRSADMVVIDSPPTLAVADAVSLARHVDGVVLVLDAGRTSREMARNAIAALRFAGARVLGAVLNRAPNRATYA